jgi:MFS family permease
MSRIVESPVAVTPPLARNRDFLLLTLAGVVSSIGGRVSQLALPILALALTNSPAIAGLLAAAQQLPYLLFSLPAGVWVDRADRKRVLVACDFIRFGLLLSVPIAYAFGALTVAQLFIVVFLQGVCTVLFAVAELAALPSVVARAQLAPARAVNQGVESAAEVLGPSLGGLVIGLGGGGVAGAAWAYLVDGCSYLASGTALLAIRRKLQAAERPPTGNLRTALREGLAFIRRNRLLRFLMLLTASINCLQAPLYLFTVIIAQTKLGLAAPQLGLVFGIAGGAAVLGATLAPVLYARLPLRVILIGSIVVWIGALLVLARADSLLALAGAWMLIHFCWPVYDVAVVTERLAATPDELHGRVISAFRTVSYGVEPLGMALGGVLVALTGATPLILAIAGLHTLCAGWAALDWGRQSGRE